MWHEELTIVREELIKPMNELIIYTSNPSVQSVPRSIAFHGCVVGYGLHEKCSESHPKQSVNESDMPYNYYEGLQ